MSILQPQQQPSSILPPPLPQLTTDEIERRLKENDLMLEEWKALFAKTDAANYNHHGNQQGQHQQQIIGTLSQADAIAHQQLRRRINENLALLASHLKVFFAITKAEKDLEMKIVGQNLSGPRQMHQQSSAAAVTTSTPAGVGQHTEALPVQHHNVEATADTKELSENK